MLEVQSKHNESLKSQSMDKMKNAEKMIRNANSLIANSTSKNEKTIDAERACSTHAVSLLLQSHTDAMERERFDHDVIIRDLKEKHAKEIVAANGKKRELQVRHFELLSDKKSTESQMKDKHAAELADVQKNASHSISVAKKKAKMNEHDARLAKSRMERLKSTNATLGELRKDLANAQVRCMELEDDLAEALASVDKCTPRVIAKECSFDGGQGARQAWPEWVAQIVLEMLSHRTPPSCIAANILTVAESLHQEYTVDE